MRPQAQIVHQTRGRLRLRIPEKRKDLPYFVGLYEQLQQTPAVEEITMNPLTGSVLLQFDAGRRNTLIGALADSRLIELGAIPASGIPPADGSRRNKGQLDRSLPGQIRSATDARTVLFLIVLGLSIHQLLKGQILAPALTLLMYGADLAVGRKRETPKTG